MSAVAVHHDVRAVPGLPADAPTVLLSNSLGSTFAMWDQQLDPLSRHFRIIRYNTRGHGDSPVPTGPYTIDDLTDDVVTLLDRLDIERVHFVGLSLGGMTGLRLAARNPERVDRLAVMCTSALLGPVSAWHERAALVRSRGAAAVAESVVTRWYTDDFARRNPARIATARAMVAATPAEGYASCCEAISTMDLTDDLPSITAQTLAIAGAEDPATPPPHLARIAAGVAEGRLVTVPLSAHMANDEQPAFVTTALHDHLLGATARADAAVR